MEASAPSRRCASPDRFGRGLLKSREPCLSSKREPGHTRTERERRVAANAQTIGDDSLPRA